MNDRRTILRRRQRFVALALAATACGPERAARIADPPPSAPPGEPRSGGGTIETTEPAIPPPPAVDAGAAVEPPHSAAIDSDGDGVPDARDACPAAAGVDAVDSMNAGCPARPCLSVLPASEIEVLVRIQFESGQARVTASALPILDDLARVLADHDEIELEVVGHTDAMEPDSLGLSRAENVRSALVSRGVSPARLGATNAGAREPRASNTSAAGRAENRRVEFVRKGPRAPLEP